MYNNLIILKKPKGSTAEAIRTLRTNLQFTFIDNSVNTLMVTSSIPGEGKSFISSNLAVSFAMTDKKVLLVDCDLRKGVQRKVFEVEEEKGLSNLLLDDVNKFKKYIVKTKVDNLYLLPSGVVPPNPSELLNSEKNKELIGLLKENYDLIIFDCPPVNGITDSLVLTSLVDEAVLVCARKKTPTDLLLASKKVLESTGVKIAGVVVNKMEKSKSNYYYGKYYS